MNQKALIWEGDFHHIPIPATLDSPKLDWSCMSDTYQGGELSFAAFLDQQEAVRHKTLGDVHLRVRIGQRGVWEAADPEEARECG